MALAEVVLGEAKRRLCVPMEGTAACIHGRTHLVRGLYERLVRLADTSPSGLISGNSAAANG
ncbi:MULTISPECIES: hypothetical protein [unclassified Streptomyces]|uniref:hypothetical protein n=1 Tax=unclassified Streptomyces TaxID=2593676 RepID=UPI003D94A504